MYSSCLWNLGGSFTPYKFRGSSSSCLALWAGIGELHRQDKTSLAALHREMLVLIGRSLWTSKGRHPSCSAIIGKVFQKDSQNCWPRRSLETICHTALKLYRKSDKAEFYFPVCSLHLPSLLTWGEHQEYLVQEILYMVQYSTPVIATFALHFLFFPWELHWRVHISKHAMLQYKQVFGQRKKYLSVMDNQIPRTDLIPQFKNGKKTQNPCSQCH